MRTSAFEIAGYRVTRNRRIVHGSIGARLQTQAGGDITLFPELCEKTRGDAFERMMDHGAQLAEALIGVRYDATELTHGVTEVLCCGTAVKVEAIR